MKQTIQIVTPNDYSAITLKQYLLLQRDLKAYEGDKEAITATLFYHLCGVTPDILRKIDTQTFTQISDRLFSFIAQNEFDLQRFVTIGGVEYGFEPDLSKMAYGAYVDISKYEKLDIDEDWKKIMSILYRPVTKKIGKLYDIQPYTGDEENEHWNDVNMEVHFGALFFFINLSKVLLNTTLKSLIQQEEIPPNIKSILVESGEIINQL